MEGIFAEELRRGLDEHGARYPQLRQVRDVMAHVDEYIESKGRRKEQWFDTTSKCSGGGWLFRVGNSPAIDMPQLAADTADLAKLVMKITCCAVQVDVGLAAAHDYVRELASQGIYADATLDARTGTLQLANVRWRQEGAGEFQ